MLLLRTAGGRCGLSLAGGVDLRRMRVVGPRVDLEVAVDVPAQAVAREHTADGRLYNAARLPLHHVAEGRRLEAAHVTSVAVVLLVLHLVARDPDLLRVPDHDEVPHGPAGRGG